jgi:hypothetical protein
MNVRPAIWQGRSPRSEGLCDGMFHRLVLGRGRSQKRANSRQATNTMFEGQRQLGLITEVRRKPRQGWGRGCESRRPLSENSHVITMPHVDGLVRDRLICTVGPRSRSVAGMPIGHRAVNTLGCTIAVWDGSLTSEDMAQQLIRLASDPEWPPGPSHLVDCTTLEGVIIPDPDLLELLYDGARFVERVRVAVVVRPDFLDETRAHFHTAVDAFEAATFTDVDTACVHLGVDPVAVRATIDELRREFSRPAAPY